MALEKIDTALDANWGVGTGAGVGAGAGTGLGAGLATARRARERARAERQSMASEKKIATKNQSLNIIGASPSVIAVTAPIPDHPIKTMSLRFLTATWAITLRVQHISL